eukprot:307118_1
MSLSTLNGTQQQQQQQQPQYFRYLYHAEWMFDIQNMNFMFQRGRFWPQFVRLIREITNQEIFKQYKEIGIMDKYKSYIHYGIDSESDWNIIQKINKNLKYKNSKSFKYIGIQTKYGQHVQEGKVDESLHDTLIHAVAITPVVVVFTADSDILSSFLQIQNQPEYRSKIVIWVTAWNTSADSPLWNNVQTQQNPDRVMKIVCIDDILNTYVCKNTN